MASQPPAKKRTRSRSNKLGRPTKCTPDVIRKVRTAILKGAGREDAARSAGVGRATLLEWLARGAKGEAPYADLLDEVEGAESELVRKAGAVVTDLLGSSKTPHAVRFAAAKLVLERRRTEVWGPRGSVRVSGPGDGPVPVAAQVEHSGSVQVAVEGEVRLAVTAEEMAQWSTEQIEAFARGLGGERGEDDNDEGGAG